MIDLETVGILVLTAIASSVVVTLIMPEPKKHGRVHKKEKDVKNER